MVQLFLRASAIAAAAAFFAFSPLTGAPYGFGNWAETVAAQRTRAMAHAAFNIARDMSASPSLMSDLSLIRHRYLHQALLRWRRGRSAFAARSTGAAAAAGALHPPSAAGG